MIPKTNRTFTDTLATRERVPLLIGITGPSGGGKTGSALELAMGIQEIVGGDIGGIDSEAQRMKHYAGERTFSDPAKKFQFRHLSFGAPFNPMSYWAAIDHYVSRGVRTVIVDSMSHEHEGPGGVLEMHELEMYRLAELWKTQPTKTTMAAWGPAKAERRQLINNILQQNVNFIFCFRAKEKIKMVPGKDPVQLGWQPIAGEEFVFEMTLNCLLPPGANGVPEWSPEEKAEKQMIKLPQQFRSILTPGRPMSIAVGRELATWAQGGAGAPARAYTPSPPASPRPAPGQPPTAPGSDGPTPEQELQGFIDQFEPRLNPKGVIMAKEAILEKHAGNILVCLKALRPVVAGLKAEDSAGDAFNDGGSE